MELMRGVVYFIMLMVVIFLPARIVYGIICWVLQRRFSIEFSNSKEETLVEMVTLGITLAVAVSLFVFFNPYIMALAEDLEFRSP